MKIGILALQGAFREHENILNELDIKSILVKSVSDLEGIDGIILPGGESTAIGKLLVDFKMLEPLKKMILNGLPTFGTCAGMILLAKNLTNDTRSHLQVMDIAVKRNAYGKQLDSFTTLGEFKGIDGLVNMVFIRAPYIQSIGKEVDILATVNGNIVGAREGNMLAISFHPELTKELKVHKYFIEMIQKNLGK